MEDSVGRSGWHGVSAGRIFGILAGALRVANHNATPSEQHRRPFSNYTMDRRDIQTSDLSEFEIRRAELVGQIGDVRPVILSHKPFLHQRFDHPWIC